MTRPPSAAHPRAGKGAGEVDWERVSKTPLLRLHAALIMGIADPVLMTSPMSEAEGAWVRQHAWTPHLRTMEDVYPYGYRRWCSCQRGTCWNCLAGRCDICVHRQNPPERDDDAGAVTDQHGYVVARVIHLRGQKPCLWVCKCPCEQRGVIPVSPPSLQSLHRRPSHRRLAGQLGLFEVVS